MSLRSQLSVWCYTPPSSAYPLIAQDYGEQVEALEITTVAPGGFGDLACVVKLPEPRLPRPELGLFSRVCVRDGFFTVFGGEWADPALVLDGATGDHMLLSALGGGVALRDDPDDSAYTNQTGAAIIQSEFTKRSAYLAIDADQALVLPGAPATTFSPLYDGFNLEEIAGDVCQLLGDYTWGVWDHGTKRDPAGFPTWQLQVHARDTSTTHYLALAEDVVSWRVAPSQQRAYNVVQVNYVDTNGGPATVTVSDARLNGDGSQGSAPFRRRKLRRSLGRAPLTAAQATAIANAWLSGYQNVTNKVEVQLRAIRDASGQPLPLHQARADRNLYVPELAVRGQTLPFSAQAGVNQFYIVETLYRERSNGDVVLLLQLDNYADRAASTLAQLKLAYDAASRSRGTLRPVFSPGAVYVGSCGGSQANAGAGNVCTAWVPFPSQFTKVPTVTLNVTGSTNASSIGVANVGATGFNLQWTAPAAGASSVLASYTAQG